MRNGVRWWCKASLHCFDIAPCISRIVCAFKFIIIDHTNDIFIDVRSKVSLAQLSHIAAMALEIELVAIAMR
jgi:hypothetical protein